MIKIKEVEEKNLKKRKKDTKKWMQINNEIYHIKNLKFPTAHQHDVKIGWKQKCEIHLSKFYYDPSLYKSGQGL